jgi:non-heme chloroperoxidase
MNHSMNKPEQMAANPLASSMSRRQSIFAAIGTISLSNAIAQTSHMTTPSSRSQSMLASKQTHRIPGAFNTEISAHEWGNPSSKPIIFVHGFLHSHLSWAKQMSASQLSDFRLIALDLRGHGMSQKPLVAEAYTDSRIWADDIMAVITTLKLDKPTLVGWSYGGRCVLDHVRHHGDKHLNALCFTGTPFIFGTPEAAKFVRPAALPLIPAMASGDSLIANITATRAFLGLFTQQPMERADFETLLATNLMVPINARGFMARRLEGDNRAVLASVGVPTQIHHGALDQIFDVSIAKLGKEVAPKADLRIHDRAGHMLFWEHADAFNQALASLAR